MERRLDSGAVLSRARPVLTFATHVSDGSTPDPGVREPTPTPAAMSFQPARRAAPLPVIARIQRRRGALDVASPLLSWLVRAPALVRHSGAGTMVVAGLVIGTLGAIAGHGLWSLPSFVSPGASSRSDATGSEPLLARDPLAPRIESTPPLRTPASTLDTLHTPHAPYTTVAPSPPPRSDKHAALRPLVKPATRNRTLAIVARR
jgi:hypothetical protein